jgi:hypothetical protein
MMMMMMMMMRAAVPGVSASEASRKDRRWFQLHSVRHGRHPAMAQAQLSFAACDADLRRQLYRQPLLDLQEPSTEGECTDHFLQLGLVINTHGMKAWYESMDRPF